MTMIGKIRALIAAALFGAAMLSATPAAAQATRTWVSGVGDDVNPCSRTAPCKTFAGAISKTAAGGEINCLDPGGFGAVTITKSLTIDCHYTEGGALAGGNGITVNALASDTVVIRGLDLFGVNPPSNGVRFIAGGTLHIEDCVIRRFNAANSAGVLFAPSGASRLIITNTSITENGNGITGGGVVIAPTGASGSAKVVLRNVHVKNNGGAGFKVDLAGTTAPAGVAVSLIESDFVGNSQGVQTNVPVATSATTIMIAGSMIAYNANNGILSSGSNASILVGTSTVVGNGAAIVAQNGSTILSYTDNRVDGNINSDGTFTGTVLKK